MAWLVFVAKLISRLIDGGLILPGLRLVPDLRQVVHVPFFANDLMSIQSIAVKDHGRSRYLLLRLLIKVGSSLESGEIKEEVMLSVIP